MLNFEKMDILEGCQSSFHGSGTGGGLKRGHPVVESNL